MSQAALLPFCSVSEGKQGGRPCALDPSYLGTDFVETCGDGFCWCVTSKHMTLQNPRVFVSCYISKIPVQRQFARILGKGAFSQHALLLRRLTELIASMPAVNCRCRLKTETRTPTATDSRGRGQWLLGTVSSKPSS